MTLSTALPNKHWEPQQTMHMLHYAAFHLGLHSLPKFMFAGIRNENGLCII